MATVTQKVCTPNDDRLNVVVSKSKPNRIVYWRIVRTFRGSRVCSSRSRSGVQMCRYESLSSTRYMPIECKIELNGYVYICSRGSYSLPQRVNAKTTEVGDAILYAKGVQSLVNAYICTHIL